MTEYRVGPSDELVKAAAKELRVERGGIKYPDGPVPKASPRMVPYGETGSGHAGNASSKDRQEREDSLGTTAYRQRAALTLITNAKSEGMTVMEFEEGLGLHHGQASSALSHLHRAGYVRRLKMRRKGQEIYVLPDHVNGRDESPYRPRGGRKHPRFTEDEEVMKAMDAAGIRTDAKVFATVRRFLELLP